ncbi:MAG: hypothetical protein NT026_01960 [Candidatus Staskawiczbacteria bacterium]|nr:hypothetical protein [Candidatus Staskawiczbacteria bacterium]
MKKIVLPAMLFVSALVISSLLYFGVEMQGNDKSKMLGALSFLAENSHTGLITSPGNQLALKDKEKNADQYAVNAPLENNAESQASGTKNVAVGELPTVLFDISAQPLFGKSSEMSVVLWMCGIAAVLLAIIFLARRIYKKIRLKKIRKIA